MMIFVFLFCGAGVVLCLVMAWTMFSDDLLGVVLGIVMVCSAALIAIIPIAVIEEENSPDLATLKKKDFACTSSHTDYVLVWVGKMLVPMPREICDQYGRVGK